MVVLISLLALMLNALSRQGSAIGREYPEEKAATNPRAVLKDLNWVHRGRALDLGPEKRAFFEEQLRADTEFLQKMGIMDYSLLVGFHDMIKGNRDNLRDGMLTVFQVSTNRSITSSFPVADDA